MPSTSNQNRFEQQDAEEIRPHPVLASYHQNEEERKQGVQEYFDRSARHYDWINQIMSFGSGHWYRRQALRRTGLKPGDRYLDVACGTGVLTHHGSRFAGTQGLALGLDPSQGMLRQASQKGLPHLLQGRAEFLPFADDSFSVLTMGYALRHVTDLRRTFAEYRRVLSPNGRILILEITPPKSKLGFVALKVYLRFWVPMVARLGGGRDAQTLMKYYWDTIEHCVNPETIQNALREAGFRSVGRRRTLGVFSEYLAVK